jgi:dihydroorotate dehydrogenase electron transfer subunit
VRQFELRLTEIATVGGLIQMRCAGADPGTTPGQFCLALAPDRPAVGGLRQPIFPWRETERETTFFVPATHPFAHLSPGQALDVIGPLGRGFRLNSGASHLLVIASALERVLPLVETSLRLGVDVTALTPRSADLLPSDVEIHRGPLTAELAAWADVVALDVSDPHTRAQHIRSLAPTRGSGYIQALVTPLMPCGTGACQACWVDTGSGRRTRLACVDGPVFHF